MEFVAKLGDSELGRVFTGLVEALNLAGDMGLLLRLETLIASKSGQTSELFAPSEQRIRAVLARFANDESGKANTRRRLFADDAAHGVALLGVAEKKFDVVLMNPPFGLGSMRAKRDFEKAYSQTKNDLYAAFVERCIEMLAPSGMMGALTSRTGFFLSSFRGWREGILSNAPPVVFADLGLGVMDAALVEGAAYCLKRTTEAESGTTTFLRLLEVLRDKGGTLREAIASPESYKVRQRFEVNPKSFRTVPGAPFAYWVSDAMRRLYASDSSFGSNGRSVRVGLQTSDDFRFVRAWWEVDPHHLGKSWFLFAKGGKYSPFYSDIYLCVNWEPGARELWATNNPTIGKPYSNIWMLRDTAAFFFFRPGLTWPRRTKSELSLRVMPAGCVFADKGPAAFVEQDDGQHLMALLAVASSKAFRSLLEFQLAAADAKAGGAARSYEIGIIDKTPVPTLSSAKIDALAKLAQQAWSLKRQQDASDECSHAFVVPAALSRRVAGTGGDAASASLADIQRRIDELCYEYYGVEASDRAVIEGSFERAGPHLAAEAQQIAGDDEDGEECGHNDNQVQIQSWLVGVSFGRFDPRLATTERAIPAEPQPFAPLPPRSPGMLPEDEDPAQRSDIFVDEEGHNDDLTARTRAVAERVRANVSENLRGWLANEFFPLHIKIYSRSRRKAPIYWQLATPSASYSVWLYIHAFTKDTLYRVQNDYVAPKLAHEERRLESLTRERRDSVTTTERGELPAQEMFVQELRALLEEVKRIAPLWSPNLDDGVIINFAPLWRLVPHHKPWQKELKSIWDALCEGEYDWTHLAMHLWPERVVAKCVKDRSLAIAHGLEDTFWAQGNDGKWTARRTPIRTIEDLVRERTSPAVKSALKRLLEAPSVNGNTGRARGARRQSVAAVAGGGV
jgi:hypothetical protein